MTVQQYREHPALNFSLLKNLLDSPAHFKAAQDEEKEETAAMRVGTLCHAMVLEGKDLTHFYAIKPAGMSFATREGKAWRDSQTLPILKEEDANSIPRVAAAIAANPSAVEIMNSCQHRETPMFATLQGVECKALLDMHGQEWGDWSITDLKTTVDASPRGFAKAVVNMHHDLQMEFYKAVFSMANKLEKPPLWTWIAAEKKAPYFNVVFTGEEFQESGLEKLDKVLTLYKRCTDEDRWPFAVTGIHRLQRPAWATTLP